MAQTHGQPGQLRRTTPSAEHAPTHHPLSGTRTAQRTERYSVWETGPCVKQAAASEPDWIKKDILLISVEASG